MTQQKLDELKTLLEEFRAVMLSQKRISRSNTCRSVLQWIDMEKGTQR